MNDPADPMRGSILTIGFGCTVAMWGGGYAGRLPALLLPSPVLLVLMLACLPAGGWLLGRYGARSWRAGAGAGLLSGLLNLLVLGSLLSGSRPGELVPSALWWVPGSLLVSALLAATGVGLGRRSAVDHRPDWVALFVRVTIGATLLLLAVGGLVTSNEAGLAVVDWPNSFGYNMFLYPFSRMSGAVYYEHAHRLFGALVGLTTLVLAVLLSRVEPRPWVRRVGWVALAMVIVQGLLGGLRVTGRLTLSDSAQMMSPNLFLALLHGVLAQLFFATLVAIGAFTSAEWRGAGAGEWRPRARGDRLMTGFLVVLMIGQLVLGATQRHFQQLLMAHIVTGVALVAPLALHVGIRAWGLNPDLPLLRRLGLGLVGAIGVQVLLGFGAFLGTRAVESGEVSETLAVTVATAHQWFGAVIFALAVLLACWSFRHLRPHPSEH
jgi:cytochrome c oxidase assembly protein subunit 15